MKKITILISSICLSIIFVACAKTDKFIGTWKGQSPVTILGFDEVADGNDHVATVYFTFNNDGTGSYAIIAPTYLPVNDSTALDFTYEADSEIITLFFPERSKERYEYKFDGDSLTLSENRGKTYQLSRID